MTPHEQDLVERHLTLKAYTGKNFDSPTIQAVLRSLSDAEFYVVKSTCHTFKEIMEKVTELKALRNAV